MKTNANEQNTFAMTCPLLLTEEQCNDPYSVIEQFFSFSGLGGYREELTVWFKNALSEGVKCKRTSDLLFIHNQFVQLIQAGFIIAQNGLRYTPTSGPNGVRFCDWLVKSSYTKENNCIEHHAYNNPYWLKVHDREAPLEYLQKTITIEAATYLRKGLHEWQNAASSKQMSLTDMGNQYLFEFYVLLQKIVEACYLLLLTDKH